MTQIRHFDVNIKLLFIIIVTIFSAYAKGQIVYPDMGIHSDDESLSKIRNINKAFSILTNHINWGNTEKQSIDGNNQIRPDSNSIKTKYIFSKTGISIFTINVNNDTTRAENINFNDSGYIETIDIKSIYGDQSLKFQYFINYITVKRYIGKSFAGFTNYIYNNNVLERETSYTPENIIKQSIIYIYGYLTDEALKKNISSDNTFSEICSIWHDTLNNKLYERRYDRKMNITQEVIYSFKDGQMQAAAYFIGEKFHLFKVFYQEPGRLNKVVEYLNDQEIIQKIYTYN